MAARAGAPLRLAGEDALTAGRRIVGSVPPGMLAIQGPPGSGKTYTAAGMILTLVRRGRRVGVSANSHKVIGHLLDELREAAAKSDALNAIRIGQKPGQGEKPTSPWARALGEAADVVVALRDGTVNVVGGTAWLWSRPELAGAVDVLFVDEAGQLALANAVAVSPAAGTIVLLGDPQQLEQPLKGSHPPGAERSALGHVLDGRPTIPPDLGLFLEHTWRLHPDLCAYTSETFYANELEPEPTLATQALEGRGLADGTGVRWLPVAHAGNAVEAREEAVAITALVRELLSSSPTWTDRFGTTRAITLADVVIVAPYNAHVELIGETLAAAGLRDARVGTVDKFQGQEAPISIYSMATSSPEEAPRGMEFLYSRNRLNVATSRARCVAIVVASPALIRVQCHTPRQMRLANALCRLVERADAGAPTDPGHRGVQTGEPAGVEVVGALR
jgi:uncharacterized protein